MTGAVSSQASAVPQAASAAPVNSTAAAAAPASGIMGMLTQRYKPISTRDITAVKALQIGIDPTIAGIAADAALGDANASAVIAYIDQLTGKAAAGQQGQQAATDAANAGTAVQGAGTAGAQAQAQAQASAQQQAAAQQAAAAQAQQQAAAAAQARQQQAAATTTTAAAGTSAAGATSTGTGKYDYWSAHIAQYKGKYLTDGPSMRPNCGPASVTMALRLIGRDIPGFNGQRSEAVLDQARIIATGKNDVSVGTTDTELERVITAAGGKWSESSDLNQMLGWVRQGIPVVLSGNPAKGWDSRYSADQVYPFDGGHWVTVSGYDAKTGFYIVNDPLSQIGPIEVSAQELANYNNAHGKLGIAVFN